MKNLLKNFLLLITMLVINSCTNEQTKSTSENTQDTNKIYREFNLEKGERFIGFTTSLDDHRLWISVYDSTKNVILIKCIYSRSGFPFSDEIFIIK